MKKALILFSIFYFLLSNHAFAQEVVRPASHIIPRPALPGPPPSMFAKLLSPVTRELPPVLNLTSRKLVTVFGNRFLRQAKELKTFVLQSPFSSPRFSQNAVVVFSTLRGLSPTQVLNMSIFYQGKALFILDGFANQIILKLNEKYSDGDELLVVAQYEEKKGSGDIKVLESRAVLPKRREI